MNTTNTEPKLRQSGEDEAEAATCLASILETFCSVTHSCDQQTRAWKIPIGKHGVSNCAPRNRLSGRGPPGARQRLFSAHCPDGMTGAARTATSGRRSRREGFHDRSRSWKRKMSEPKAFILHLERAAQRRPQVERLRAALPCASEIVDAMDGSKLSQETVDAVYIRQLHRPRFSHPLNRAEIGAFLSHRAAWRRIVEEGLDYGLVFEDDAEIDAEAFARTCHFAQETRPRWDYALAPRRRPAPRGRSSRKRTASPWFAPMRRLCGPSRSSSPARRRAACSRRRNNSTGRSTPSCK